MATPALMVTSMRRPLGTLTHESHHRALTVVFCDLRDFTSSPRAPSRWMYLAFNPRRCGTMMAIDGQETWLIHNFLYNDGLVADKFQNGRVFIAGDAAHLWIPQADFESWLRIYA
jgi:2-polyprenyl-6-methoxyphenol hydroxylase-like FAD-dependent oxidoreductase